MKTLREQKLDAIRTIYPVGARVKLIHMEDKNAPPVGTLGTIKGIDCLGDIEVTWDTGSTLKLILECDRFCLIK